MGVGVWVGVGDAVGVGVPVAPGVDDGVDSDAGVAVASSDGPAVGPWVGVGLAAGAVVAAGLGTGGLAVRSAGDGVGVGSAPGVSVAVSTVAVDPSPLSSGGEVGAASLGTTRPGVGEGPGVQVEVGSALALSVARLRTATPVARVSGVGRSGPQAARAAQTTRQAKATQALCLISRAPCPASGILASAAYLDSCNASGSGSPGSARRRNGPGACRSQRKQRSVGPHRPGWHSRT